MGSGVQCDGHGNTAHPHVLLVVGVGDPQVAVLGHAVVHSRCRADPWPFLNATCVLRAVALVLSTVAQGCHLAIHQRERGVLQSVLAQADGQRPAVLRRIVDGGVGAVGEPLSPDLCVRVDEAWRTVAAQLVLVAQADEPPRVAAVGRQAGDGVLPQGHLAPIGQGIAAECLVGFVERQELVAAVGLLHPLHTLHGVGQHGVDGMHKRLVLTFLIIGVLGVLLREVVVVVDKVDGTERAVLLHLAHHAAYAVAVVGVVLHGQADAVVARGNQPSVGGHVPAYPLVHHGLQVVGGGQVGAGLRPPFGDGVFREQLDGTCPRVAVVAGLHHRLARCLVLMARVGQVVHVEPPVPVGYHRLVVVGPRLLAAHGLYGVYSHHGLQPAVVAFRAGDGLARVVYHVAVVLDESLHQLFVGPEHRAVLVAHGEADLAGLVLEGLEVFRAVGTVDLVAVGVVVDVPPVAHLRRRRPLGELLRERLRCLAPRAVGRLGEGHLDVAHGAGVVLHHHHVVTLTALHQRGIDGREARLIEQLRL